MWVTAEASRMESYTASGKALWRSSSLMVANPGQGFKFANFKYFMPMFKTCQFTSRRAFRMVSVIVHPAVGLSSEIIALRSPEQNMKVLRFLTGFPLCFRLLTPLQTCHEAAHTWSQRKGRNVAQWVNVAPAGVRAQPFAY
ncbi:hypothetical protein NDU88_005356 [Pleurodeles waltl]|uniref:Uncharacterized protein n=1 Tax=Pleurodeles waltl TaxID=8319 RepID=A0AAV7L251_PLEWA|nr:hypothetical protein NDU88_005356 [Pleurodeles waltl]